MASRITIYLLSFNCIFSGFLLGSTTFFQFTPTGSSNTIALKVEANPSIDTNAGIISLEPGDEIGVFTPAGICVGARVWNNESMGIPVWIKEYIPVETDGIVNGEKMSFRVWQRSTNTEMEIVDVTFEIGSETFYSTQHYVLGSLIAYKPPEIPVIQNPQNNETGIPISLEFRWHREPTAISYDIQLGTDFRFFGLTVDATGLEDTIYVITGLEYNAVYYWRVRSVNRGGTSDWSQSGRFVTEEFVDTVGIHADTLKIVLHRSWNMISSNILPAENRFENIFKDIRQESLLVKDHAGNVYWPASQIYDIDEWDLHQSYLVYVTEPDTLYIYGSTAIDSMASIMLGEGWNSPSFLPHVPLDVETAFSSLADRIVLVRTNDGLIYWPEFSINFIQRLYPGMGYQVYMREQAELDFTLITGHDSTVLRNDGYGSPALEASEDMKIYSPAHKNTGENSILLLKFESAIDGDEIGIWDGTRSLVGAGSIMNNIALVVVWGNNSQTVTTKDGAIRGERLSLTYFSALDDKEYEVSINEIRNLVEETQPDSVLRYFPDSIILADVKIKSVQDDEETGDGDEGDDEIEDPRVLPTRYTLAQNFPNPFNPRTTIQFSVPEMNHVYLAIFNSLGQEVAVLVDEIRPTGTYTESFDAGRLPSGVYIYHLRAGYFKDTRKMLLLR